MAKKGSRRPWRVRFAWAGGVCGCETFEDLDRAKTLIDTLRRNAGRNGSGCHVTVVHRDHPDKVTEFDIDPAEEACDDQD